MTNIHFYLFSALVLASGCGSTRPFRPASAPEASEASAPAAAGGIPDANMARSEIPESFLWDTAVLFGDHAAFERGLTDSRSRREKLGECLGALSAAARLAACLEEYFAVLQLTNRLTLYASMHKSVDQESSEAQARVDRSQAAMNELMAFASNMRSEILAIDDRALARAFSREPALSTYRPYLDRMRRRQNAVLDEQGERVLSLAGDNLWAEIDLNEIPSEHERTFRSFLAQLALPTITNEEGEEVQLTFSNYGKYRGSSDRRVRRDTVDGFFAALRAYDETLASMLTGQARFSVFLARSRGYESALEAYLHKDDADPSVYRNLVSTIENNVAPLHRYMRMRKERMGVEELHIYDLYTPVVPAVERRIPYEEATQMVIQALAPLGEEYARVLEQGLDPRNGWIDLYPHGSKNSGAYSASVHGTHPFVFMNYFEELDDMMTLAHEYGHALHSHYAMEAQSPVTFNYVPLVAETASTTSEVLVIRHLITEAADDAERLYLLGQLVEMIRTTIYRQTLFASFELAVHTAVEEGTPTTAEFLDELYAGLVRRYYGDALTVGENDGMEWAYIPHLYYKFYVYSYAMGLSAGIALGDLVLGGGDGERDAYLGMLSGGGSRPPLELLRSAGVDPSDPATVEAAARLLDESLTQMEEILARQENDPSLL